MSGAEFIDEVKLAAVAQVVNLGYPVREMAALLAARCPVSGMQA